MLSSIRGRFASWAVRLERSADARLCTFLRRRPGWEPTVVPYLGHGTTERAHLRARVLLSRTADARRRKPRSALIAGLAPFLSVDVPGEQVTIVIAGRRVSAVTSPEGYVETDVELPGLAPGWHRVTFGLTGDTAYSNDGRVLVVDPAATLGVVSDIDDTVIHTGLTRLVDALRTTLLIPEHARTEVAGAAELYRALVAGTAGTQIFYVSSGAWNLFPAIERFLSRKGFPEGPLLMTDWGPTGSWLFREDSVALKTRTITALLQEHSHLSWLLFGDSGQDDAEAYAAVARAYPDRIRAIYIRDVPPQSPMRADRVRRIADEIEALGVPMLLVSDSAQAAEHAALRLGLIDDRDLAQVTGAVTRHRRAPFSR
jgi:phosphatidate phosphatase APP1